MYTNVSKKIKIMAFVFLGVGAAISMVGFAAGLVTADLVGAVVSLLGGALIAVSSFLVYGFAESLETNKAIEAKLDQLNMALNPNYKHGRPMPEVPVQPQGRSRREAQHAATPNPVQPSQNIKFCNKCGSMIPAGQNVCVKCGAPQPGQPAEAPQPAVPADAPQTPVMPQNTWRCRTCGAQMSADRNVCWQCGTPRAAE